MSDCDHNFSDPDEFGFARCNLCGWETPVKDKPPEPQWDEVKVEDTILFKYNDVIVNDRHVTQNPAQQSYVSMFNSNRTYIQMKTQKDATISIWHKISDLQLIDIIEL